MCLTFLCYCSFLMLIAHCPLLIGLCSLLTALCSLLFAPSSLLFAHCSLPLAHCSLLLSHCSLLIALCSLLFAPCLLLFAHSSLLLDLFLSKYLGNRTRSVGAENSAQFVPAKTTYIQRQAFNKATYDQAP